MKSSAVLAAALMLVSSLGAASQTVKPARQATIPAAKSPTSPDDLPPLSYTCTMHPEIVEDKGGECPICKMTLVPIRLESVWTCSATPLAKGTIKSSPGQCPIDHTPLIQVIASVSWTCPGSDVKSMTPGSCADGTPRTKTFEARAHGNHNPQHGGSFFMAPDSWHHLEGALPSAGVFRVYLYDDFTKPLKSTLFKAVKGRV
ncbi:MAG TPA: heavy metal-binding domain-containing protein, partial [Vicinamibacterales bacterium]